jgi:hypothetical protein
MINEKNPIDTIEINKEIFKEAIKKEDGTWTLVFNDNVSKKLQKYMDGNKLTMDEMTKIFKKILEEMKTSQSI